MKESPAKIAQIIFYRAVFVKFRAGGNGVDELEAVFP